jgi:hypothetical protein
MKSEERHRLETNTLATELTVWSEKLKPYTSAILFAIAVVFGLYAVLSFWNGRSDARQAKAWDDYEMALLEGGMDFRTVYSVANNEELAGTRMQDWAYLAWADRQLLLAAQNYLLDRDAAKTRLNEIKAVYDTYSTQALEPEVRSRAWFGLARVNEIQNNFDEAKKNYAQVEGALAPVAEARLKELEDRGEEFAEVGQWLATADLPRPVQPAGGATPGVRPDFDSPLPPTGTGADPFNPGEMFDVLGGAGGDEAGTRYGETDATAPAGDAAPAGGDAATTTADAAPTDEPATERASTGDATPAESTPETPSTESTPAAETTPATDAEPAGDAETADQP